LFEGARIEGIAILSRRSRNRCRR